MTSPLSYQMYLELSKMSKEELIILYMKLSDGVGAAEIHKQNMAKQKGAAKARKHLNDVRVKVFEVFVDLTNDRFPTPMEMEEELNKRFPEKVWVYDADIKREPGEQGFYRAFLDVKKYLSFVSKQQEDI